MKFDTELVGKIGSMALIDKADNLIDYTRVARLSRELRPGYVWISSGATEIGRLDYLARNGKELNGEFAKTDYSSQGQAILMQTYRQFIDPRYSVYPFLLVLSMLIPYLVYLPQRKMDVVYCLTDN